MGLPSRKQSERGGDVQRVYRAPRRMCPKVGGMFDASTGPPVERARKRGWCSVTKFKETVNCKFSSTGSFEGLGDGLLEGAKNNNSVISNTTNPNEVFQGEKSCKISLNSSSNILYATSKEFSFFDDFPFLPSNVFLELNFKSSISFEYGLLNYILNDSIEVECGGINKSDEWKKIYLDLYPLLSGGNIYSTFKIYLDGQFDNSVENNAIYFDNLKLIHGE